MDKMTVEKKVGSKVIRLIIGDLTDVEAQAYVYDITPDAKLGTGNGGALSARGGKAIQTELNEIGSCPTGEAIITTGGKTKAEKIVHVNGPKFLEPDQEGKLTSAIKAALKRCDEAGLKQIAFPPVGTGFYQVDLGLCARVMTDTITQHLEGNTSLEEVLIVALDKREYDPFQAQIGG
jgi:O-acetyl-ADP-ribose deacetylase (regulator of RNase III)